MKPTRIIIFTAAFLLAPLAHAAIVSTSGNVEVIAAPASAAEDALQSDISTFLWFERTTISGDSYFLHFDPVTETSTQRSSGSVTFDSEILQVFSTDLVLNITDATLGAPGTTYPTGRSGRGAEGPASGDLADSFSFSGNTLQFSFNAVLMDELRVLVAPSSVPEPGSLALLAIGMGGLGFIRRSLANLSRARGR